MNRRLLLLCLVFVAWSVLGWESLSAIWITKTKWWGLLGYIVVHFGLAGLVLRSAGVRLWSVALCLLGLISVERDILLTSYAFTAWTFGGFV